MNPLVSIIVPNYNKALFIADTLNSIIAQSYATWEAIIIDDGSTDNSLNIINQYCIKEPKMKSILNPTNQGGNHCRNQGIQAAKGSYIVFLDADDILDEFCLSQRIAQAQNYPDKDLWVFSMAVFLKKTGDLSKSLNWIPPFEGCNFLHLFYKHHLPWHTLQPLWSIDFLKKINGFAPDFVRLQDVELFTRALLSGARVSTFPKLPKDCNYRIDEERYESNALKHLNGFVTGAIQYYQKFYPYTNGKKEQAMLSICLLEVLSNIFHHYKKNKISLADADSLKNKLIKICNKKSHRFLLSVFSTLHIASPLHPKGLKKLTTLIITKCL